MIQKTKLAIKDFVTFLAKQADEHAGYIMGCQGYVLTQKLLERLAAILVKIERLQSFDQKGVLAIEKK